MEHKKINFFKEAFFTVWNYGTLAVLAGLYYLIRHPDYILFALACESAVLFTISRNRRFQRAIRAKRMGELPIADPDDQIRLKQQLDPDHLRSYQKFEEISIQIRQTVENMDSTPSALWGVSLSKLDSLLNSFLRMQYFHQKYNEHLSQVDRDRIVQQVEGIKREIELKTGRLAELKSKNREILEQRLERIDKARENREVVEAELEVMFNTINLIKDQIISMSDPQGISQQIDSVLTNMKDTEYLVREMDIFLNHETSALQSEDETRPPEPDRRLHEGF